MSMVEKVARALLKNYWNISTDRGAADWDRQDDFTKEMYLSHARVAIEAMKEPDDLMLNAPIGEDYESGDTVAGFLDNWSARSVYGAMIEAALKE